MEITEYLVNRFRDCKNKRLVVGIGGRAGSGKTTLVQKIVENLATAQIETVAYSGDWRFVLDSKERREWLHEKWRAGMDAYLKAINQFSWWDFGAIFRDLVALQHGRAVRIPDAYDRRTGTKAAEVTLQPIQRGIILYENCILGDLETIPRLDIIVLVNTPDQVCLERILRKDAHRRPVAEIVTRYLMTTFSENIFFRILREQFSDRAVACDSDGKLSAFPSIQEITHIPVPMPVRKSQEFMKGTIFCDLDGTLIKHVPVPSPSGDDLELLEGSLEKLQEFQEKGYVVILTTSRTQSNVCAVIEKLRALGLNCDQIICDLPLGPRHLINDSKGEEVRAIAHPVIRDAGIKDVSVE
jgi:uridine kinase